MKTKTRIPEEEKMTLLPPCAICSARSSGIHFGVNTCEACKAFFRRCLNRRKETPLSCIGNGNCIINIQAKTLCSACRQDKCIRNGMSRSAIKTGRYSLERKADLIRDARAKKRPESSYESGACSPEVPSSSNSEMEVLPSGGSTSNISDTSMQDGHPTSPPWSLRGNAPEPISSTSVSQSTPDISSPALASRLTRVSISPAAHDITEMSSCKPKPEVHPAGYLPLTPASSPGSHTVLSLQQNISPHVQHGIPLVSNPTKSIDASVSTSRDLDNTIRQVAAAFELCCPYTKEISSKIYDKQVCYQEEQEFFKDLFGPMKPLGLEEYMEIYTNTGIDVDGRRDLANKLFSHVDQVIQRLIAFAKCIPGFADINVDDQIELIRAGSIDWMTIVSQSAVNVENGLLTSFFGMTFSKQDLVKLNGRENIVADHIFTMPKYVQELALDDVALALLTAVCITDPEQLLFHIKNKEEVGAVQYNLIEALQLHLSRTQERHLLVFAQIMALLTELRKSRAQIHPERIEAHGFCRKFGAMTTPLMDALVNKQEPGDEPDSAKLPLVRAVLNENENTHLASSGGDHKQL